MGFDVAAGRFEVELRQRRVVRAGAGDQHVVDRRGQPVEERPEPFEVGGIEGRDARRADLGRGALEALAIAAREDDLGALGACPSGGFESDARAPADHDDGLPGEFGFPRGRAQRGAASSGMDDHVPAAISALRAFSASL